MTAGRLPPAMTMLLPSEITVVSTPRRVRCGDGRAAVPPQPPAQSCLGLTVRNGWIPDVGCAEPAGTGRDSRPDAVQTTVGWAPRYLPYMALCCSDGALRTRKKRNM